MPSRILDVGWTGVTSACLVWREQIAESASKVSPVFGASLLSPDGAGALALVSTAIAGGIAIIGSKVVALYKEYSEIRDRSNAGKLEQSKSEAEWLRRQLDEAHKTIGRFEVIIRSQAESMVILGVPHNPPHALPLASNDHQAANHTEERAIVLPGH